MIEFIEGELVAKTPSYAVIKAGGIAYRGIVSLSTYDALPNIGGIVRLWTFLQIRDEEVLLFAFSTQDERQLFLHLISVNGVGPKLAITMLSAAKTDTIRKAVVEGDSARLKSIPKIGAKIAERIVLELKKKVGSESADFVPGAVNGKASEIREAVDALVSLGFTRVEAERAVEKAHERGADGTEELVKRSLRSA